MSQVRKLPAQNDSPNSALFKAYTGGKAWKAIRDRLLKLCYMSSDDHNWKIRTLKQKNVFLRKKDH